MHMACAEIKWSKEMLTQRNAQQGHILKVLSNENWGGSKLVSINHKDKHNKLLLDSCGFKEFFK